MKGRWTIGCRPTEPHISTTESQPEVWIHRDDPSLLGSWPNVTGSQLEDPIKLTQWPIEGQHQQLQPPLPSTPRRLSLESNHPAAARIIPLSRWPLSDPRGGRRAPFDIHCTGFNARRSADDNTYVSDPCTSRQSSNENYAKDRSQNSTGVRALKNLFSPQDKNWSQEDNHCLLSDTRTGYANTRNTCSLATDGSMVSQSPLKDTEGFGVTQVPLKDMDSSKVSQCRLSVMDLSKDSESLKDERLPLQDKERTSTDEQKLCLQGKRAGGEKCARLMSRLYHFKRSKHDNAV